jgi:hypothetical protein
VKLLVVGGSSASRRPSDAGISAGLAARRLRHSDGAGGGLDDDPGLPVGDDSTNRHDRGEGRADHRPAVPRGTPDVPVPMVPVLQLRAHDVPDLPFPAGTDLLRVLWCPNDHDKPWWRTYPVTVWRRAADVTALPSEPPATRFDEDQFAQSYVPLPCLLHPAPAVEYPHPRDLPTDVGERVEQWDREHDGAYRADLSTAVGTKVGGHPRWIQDPEATKYTFPESVIIRRTLFSTIFMPLRFARSYIGTVFPGWPLRRPVPGPAGGCGSCPA